MITQDFEVLKAILHFISINGSPEMEYRGRNEHELDELEDCNLDATMVSVNRTKKHLAHASFDIVASLLTLALRELQR